MDNITASQPASTAALPDPRGTRTTACPPATPRRGFAPGYTLVEMVGVVILAAILLRMVVPSLLGSSEVARRSALLNDLKAYTSQAALHYQDFGRFPDAIQATGTPTAGTMTFGTTPGVGLKIMDVTQQGYRARARSTEERRWECTITISAEGGSKPSCLKRLADWTGPDPSA